jgi:UDP-N-acetylmuramate--alanine ligase
MQGKPLKLFFSGIGGSGVSAIAGFMADKGHTIFGSDRAFDNAPGHPLKRIFQSMGITILPQDGKSLDDSFNLAVFSTAVEPGHPEAIRAGSLGIPVKTRPEYLAGITASFNTIAVAGTSGKSTTSGLLAFLMKKLGLEPNFLGGGRVKQFKSFSNPGNFLTGHSDHLVIEACESDGTIVNYTPQHLIILNLDLDHHAIDKTAQMFEIVMRNTRGKIFVNADDSNLKEITKGNAITFSIHNPSHYKAEGITYHPFSTDFSVNGTRFSLSLPGEYNLCNALSCIAFLSEIGISRGDIAAVLPDFQGIERRFDIHLNDGERLVIDDYAHNPHKISSLMKTVKHLGEKICYIFQPHGFGPTRLMKKEYITAFAENLRDTDRLILLPIYYVGGTASKDISSQDLADGIRLSGKSVEVIEKREDILKRVNEYKTYVVFGARDETLSDFAEEIAGAVAVEVKDDFNFKDKPTSRGF